jgi:orotate phosphoribosyltransferase
LIVDDVITSGQSTIDAIVRSREEGLEVVKALALIDRQEFNGAQNIRNYGVDFEALVRLESLCDWQAHVRSRHAESSQ